MVKLIGTGGNQAPTNNMLGNMAFQNKEGVAIDLLGLAAGTAAAPSLIPTGDPNTGVWFPAADTVAVSTGGSERVRVTSSGNLLVNAASVRTSDGITPRYFQEGSDTYEALSVTSNGGTVAAKGAFFFLARSRGTAIGSVTAVTSGDTIGALSFYGADGVSINTNAASIVGAVDGSVSAGVVPARLQFFTSSSAGVVTERMRINSSGNVGIGTASPTSRIHVYGTTSTTQQIAIDGTSNTSSLKLSYNGSQVGFFQNYQNTEINFGTSVSAPIMFYTNNTEKMRLTSAGNLGLGTASPVGILDVVTRTAALNTAISLVVPDSAGANNGAVLGLRYGTNSTIRSSVSLAFENLLSNFNSYITLSTGTTAASNVERMRIDPNGNVGIGTASPISRVDVRVGYSATVVETIRLVNPFDGSGTGGTSIYFGNFYKNALISAYSNPSVGQGGTLQLQSYNNDTTLNTGIVLNSSGNVGIGTASPLTKLHLFGTGGVVSIRLDDAVNPRNNYIGVDNYEQVVVAANESNTVGATPNIKFRINASELMRILPTGNVGIGTTTPAAQLTVNGSGGIFSYLGYNYATISQLTSSADAIFGGGVIVDTSVGGQIKKTTSDAGHMMRIQISDGIAFHTNFTGATGTTFSRTANLRMAIDINGNVIVNSAAVTTTATNGFLYVPGCAGAPTGVPTNYSGRVPIVVDTTNNKLYFYSGGAWRDAGP